MLMFHTRHAPRTIIINGASVVMSGAIDVEQLWCAGTTSQVELLDYIARAVHTSAHPLDVALMRFLASKDRPLPNHPPLHHIAFDAHVGVSGNVWHHGAETQLALIGLPEYILSHADLTENEREAAMIKLHTLSAEGHSVVAVGYAALPQQMADLREYSKQTVVLAGFVSLHHTVSPQLRHLVSNALTRGDTLCLLTGAHSDTAYHVAAQLGITSSRQQVIDARQLVVMPEGLQRSAIHSAVVFARANATEKERLIATIKRDAPTAVVATRLDELKAALKI